MKNINTDKAGTVVRYCGCEHKAQDEMYGKGMRVFNLKAKKEHGTATCTVCGAKA